MKELIKNLKQKVIKKEITPLKFSYEYSKLFDNFFIESLKKNFSPQEYKNFCLLATGSYGRNQMSPFSDIDFFFILSKYNLELEEKILDYLIYPLWDLKLQIGYCIRNTEDFISHCQNDIKEWTKTLDFRFVCGNNDLLNKINNLLKKLNKNELIKELFYLNDDRREKAGNSVYLLEPDIKNSPGGIRDINLIHWYLKIFKEDSYIFEKEKNEIKKANNYILTIRNILHLLSNRENDHFNFDYQRKVAEFIFSERLANKSIKEKIQLLMKKYYFNADIVDYYYEYIREKFSPKLYTSINYNRKIDKDFYIKNYKLYINNPEKLKTNPDLIVKSFDLMQKYRSFPSFELKTAIKKYSKHIKKISNQKAIVKIFYKLLERDVPSGFYLKLMNKLNFFSYYIPEFKKIKYKITYDMYHKYTVDMHSIYAVIKLRELFNGEFLHEYPFISALALNIPQKNYLLLSALIHDIGKGEKGEASHLIKGEKIAQKICERFGISEGYKNLILFLVRNHTLMTDTALRRDIKNEEEIINFVKKVKTIKNLNYLYLLSFSDLNSVSEKSFDKWKNNLFQELYIKAFTVMKKKEKSFLKLEEKIASIKSYAIEHLSKKEFDKFEKFLSSLSRRYILSKSESNVISLFNKLKNAKEKPFVFINFDEDSQLLKIFLYTYNLSGIFNKSVGFLTLSNLNILSAEIYSNIDGTIIDIFYTKPVYEDIYFYQRIPELQKKFKDFLKLPNEEIEKLLKAKIDKYEPENKIKIIPSITFNNNQSAFFTIIEIIAPDYPGLLFEVSNLFFKNSIEIHSARITTQGIKAIDTFYTSDMKGDKITDKMVLEKIKENFFNLIEKKL